MILQVFRARCQISESTCSSLPREDSAEERKVGSVNGEELGKRVGGERERNGMASGV
jgi:hypothetical protein